MNTETTESHTVTEVKGSRRSTFIPRHIRGGMMQAITFENTVYGTMGRICAAYKGGSWNFYEVTNGAFFMAPATSEPMQISVADNGFSGALSPEAAGIVATLMALSSMTFQYQSDERLSDAFHKLREYAQTRDDYAVIFGAID